MKSKKRIDVSNFNLTEMDQIIEYVLSNIDTPDAQIIDVRIEQETLIIDTIPQ